MPTARADRFQKEYDLPGYDAEVLTGDKALADYFEECLKEFPQAKQVSNWIMVEVMRELKKEEAGITSLKVTPRDLGRLLALVDQGTISGKIAKAVFEEMIATGQDPEAIIRRKRPGSDQRRRRFGGPGPGNFGGPPQGSGRLSGG